LWISS